jgi:hypothetical protein
LCTSDSFLPELNSDGLLRFGGLRRKEIQGNSAFPWPI